MPQRKILYLLLVIFCVAGYANSLNGSFLVDDLAAIQGNSHLAQALHFWQDPHMFLNSLDYLLGGYNPLIYHLTNLILHALNTILAFLFLCLFFNMEASFLGAALFALHPVHAEAVSWISGRPYLIMAALMLGNLLLYNSITAAEKRSRALRYFFSLLIFFYTLSNYNSFHYSLFPFLLVLFDLSKGRARKNWKLWIPFFLGVALKFIWGRALILGQAAHMLNNVGATTLNGPVYAAYSFYAHLKLLFWPNSLPIFLESEKIPSLMFKYGWLYLIPPVLFLLLAFKKAKELFFALGLFIILISPTYSPVPVASLTAERYLYIPSLGLSMFLAYLYQRYCGQYPKAKKYLLLAAALIITLYGIRAVIRNETWASPERFWKEATTSYKNSWQAHSNLGFIYLNKGEFGSSIAEYEKALAINEASADAHNNLGVAYYRRGNTLKAEENFRRALELAPGLSSAARNLEGITSGPVSGP